MILYVNAPYHRYFDILYKYVLYFGVTKRIRYSFKYTGKRNAALAYLKFNFTIIPHYWTLYPRGKKLEDTQPLLSSFYLAPTPPSLPPPSLDTYHSSLCVAGRKGGDGAKLDDITVLYCNTGLSVLTMRLILCFTLIKY